jgi:hypothetical protein
MADAHRDAAPRAIFRVTFLAIIALLHAYWFLQPVSPTLKLLAAVLVATSVLRPAIGALLFAFVAPLSTVIAGLCGGAGLGAQLLEQMALGTGAGAIWQLSGRVTGTRLGKPALLISAVAFASALSLIPALSAPSADGLLLRDLLLRAPAQSSPVWSPMFVALITAECALLGWAVERTVRHTPRLAERLVLMGLVGHAISAGLSIEAVVTAAARTGDALAALPQLLMSVRLSLETDWNAAASLFVLAGISGAGLWWTRGYPRVAICLLVLLVAAGLWITGSRIAIVLAALVMAAALAWLVARNSQYKRALGFGAVVLIMAMGAWFTARYPEGRNDKPGDTLRSRLVLMKAGMRMVEEAPIFGIGIDGFYAASGRLAEPVPGIPDVTPENAHNNFVQVLAEQGIAGVAVMLWWLGVILVSGVRAQRRQPAPLRAALLLGIVTCIGTWLTGHPLLVPEFAFVFWLYAGTLTALTPEPRSRGMNWLLGILLVGLIVSVPVRAAALRTTANLEYRGHGVSIWHHDDTQRYRNAGATFALFLPATGKPVDLPIRRSPGSSSPLTVTIRLGDRVLNRVTVESDAWQTIVVVVPEGPRRYERVDFSVEPPSAPPLLRVGRESAR